MQFRTKATDDFVGHGQKYITCIKWYRSRVISAAVTGEIDVGTFETN